MKGNLFRKLEAIGKQAARFQQAVQKAPERVGRLAEAINLTSTQLVDLKSGLRSTFDQLKADGEGPLLQVIREINESRDTIAEAGFALVGLDLELSPAPRVHLRLEPTREADPELVRRLINANPGRPQLAGILTALVRSTQVAEKLDLGDLAHPEIRIGIGPIPSLRIAWRVASPESEMDTAPTPPPVLAHAPAGGAQAPTPTPSGSTLGHAPEGGFFQDRPVYAQPQFPSEPSPPASSRAVPTPASEDTGPAAGKAPAANPLDRFKKMPDMGRRTS